MKQIFALIIILLVLAGGYFLFGGSLNTEGPVTKSGEITEVSLEQVALDGPALIIAMDENGEAFVIAVPSMGLPLCAAKDNIADVYSAGVGDLVNVSGKVDEEGRIVPCEDESHMLEITGFMKDAAFEFQFEYRKGPNGYITLEDSESTDADYVTGITLFNKAEYDELQESTEPREGPPAMHVRVYTNSENLDAAVWADEKQRESNIQLATGEPQEAIVGGANAVFYTVDGLYVTDTYVVTSGDHVYVIAGSYFEKDDTKYIDFHALVDSFTFIPKDGAMQQKIDPAVACQSALAYMTFPSSTEADAFVEACIRGEHPEVIDRYIKDLGLDGAAI